MLKQELYSQKMYSGTSNGVVGLDKAIMETISRKRAKICFTLFPVT